MPITISIRKSPENVSISRQSVIFDEKGGTIGRGEDNDWSLDDPERFISTNHSQIKFENGQFYLFDLSTNGTFYNGASEPIGKGNKVQIQDGDTFSLSDYEFEIGLSGNAKADIPALDDYNDPFSDFSSTLTSQDDFDLSAIDQFNDSYSSELPGYSQATDPLFSVDNMEIDPLRALEKANENVAFEGEEGTESFTSSYSDQLDVMSQSISWPNITPDSNGIPDDWDDDVSLGQNLDIPIAVQSEIKPTKNTITNESVNKQALFDSNQAESVIKEENNSVNKILLAEIERLKKESIGLSSSAPVYNTSNAVIKALGINQNNLDERKIEEINKILGEVVREAISGLMKVLSSRSSIKNEFRMNVTTIQPIENNPLKFSANIDDAIENMFLKDSNAYMKPIEAVKEGFETIAEHQIAILAGVRAAFKGMIARFDPVVLEKRFEKFNKAGLIQMGVKSKKWDSYKEYYKELSEDIDNSFQHLFGYEFVQAYEEQLQRLSISRKGL